MDSLLQELRGLHLIDDLRNDIRFALRSLRKHALLSASRRVLIRTCNGRPDIRIHRCQDGLLEAEVVI